MLVCLVSVVYLCYRCELFVSSNEEREKLASGLIEPFVNHLRVIESQASKRDQSSVRLEVEQSENGESWFTRRTLERSQRTFCISLLHENVGYLSYLLTCVIFVFQICSIC